MFSDLNRFAIRPTQSLNILYDTRGKNSILVKEVIDAIPGFNTLVDKEHTSVPNRSVALFTLSAFYRGTTALLKNLELSPYLPPKVFIPTSCRLWRRILIKKR